MTDQFMSIDPMVQQTDQPYVFTNDSPLNGTDPLGLEEDPFEGGGGLGAGAGQGSGDGFGQSSLMPVEGSVATEQSIRKILSTLELGRNVPVVNSESQLQKLFDKISSGGTIVSQSEARVQVELPDQTQVQLRASSSSGGKTIDVRFPNGATTKVHIK